MDFAYTIKLLKEEKAFQEQVRDWYLQKKPKNCCPTFTLEKRKPWADEAIRNIAEIEAAITLLTTSDDN